MLSLIIFALVIAGSSPLKVSRIIVNIVNVNKGNLAKFTRERESVGEFYV